jgi:hypothetical protein
VFGYSGGINKNWRDELLDSIVGELGCNLLFGALTILGLLLLAFVVGRLL